MEVDEVVEEECVKLTLHCVGVIVMPTIGPCMMMMQTTSPCGIYCVSLTQKTSDLVSPLYEHTLLLAKQPEITEDQKALDLTSLFTGGTHNVVKQRVACRYRLDTQYKQKELNKRLRELVGYTFFLDMDRSFALLNPVDTEAHLLLNDLFGASKVVRYAYFDCKKDEDHARVKDYLEMYHECRLKRYRTKKTLYENYWLEVVQLENVKQGLDTAIEHLMAYTRADLLYQKAATVNLFKGNWKAYKAIVPFFTHRLYMHSMESTYALHMVLRDAPPSIHDKLWLMPCSKRIAMFAFCCTLMKRLITQKEFSLTEEDIDLTLFADEVGGGVLIGQLYLVLSLVIKQQERSLQAALINKIKLPLLTHCMIKRLEATAKSKATLNKASVDAITLTSIYTAYHSFTGQGPPLKLDPTTFFNIEDEDEEDDIEEKKKEDGDGDGSEEEESTVDIVDEWAHSLKDFGRVLRYLYKTMPPNSTKWLIKEQKSTLVKANAILFFIAPVQTTLDNERDLATLYDKYMHGEANMQVRFNQEEPLSEYDWQQKWIDLKDAMDQGRDEDDEEPPQQHFQFVLFNPLEIIRNEDLACIKTMLFEDLFNTSIIREITDIFFVKRLSHYFHETQRELTMGLFHRERCFGSASFVTIKEEAINETVIVPQCHTFSLGAMRNLLQWFIIHRKKIRRVIMIGSPYILPSIAHGQAFLDLLRKVEARRVNTQIYLKDARNQEFAFLINKHWRSIVYDNDRDKKQQFNLLQQREELYRDDGYRVLYFVKNEALFVNFLEKLPVAASASVYCFYKAPGLTGTLADLVKNNLSVKMKTRFNPVPMDVDGLCHYNCVPKSAENDVFVITKKTLLGFDKNQFLYFFMSLNRLFVIDSPDKPATKGDLLEEIALNYTQRMKPNIRYSFNALLQ